MPKRRAVHRVVRVTVPITTSRPTVEAPPQTPNIVPRLKPNTARIMVTTRWHEDDLIGRCLEREPGLWEVLSILLEAMPGDLLGRRVSERLWPEWFTET